MAFHLILALEGLFCFELTNHRHRWRCIHSRWTTRSGNTQLQRDAEDTNAWMKSTTRAGCSYTAWPKSTKNYCLDLIKQIGKSLLQDNYCVGMCLGCLAFGRHWECAAPGHLVLVPIAAWGHFWDCGPWICSIWWASLNGFLCCMGSAAWFGVVELRWPSLTNWSTKW